MPVPRYAIAYTPPPESPLARFGAGVLGYDGYQGVEVPYRMIDGINPAILRLLTVEPRRYGFHAAFVAPFLLGETDERDLIADLEAFARRQPVVAVGALAIAAVDRSVVLKAAAPAEGLQGLAAACLEAFDVTRTVSADHPPNPYEFHMTLAGPVPEGDLKPVKRALAAAFAPMAADQLEIDAVSLLRQDSDSARFRVAERWRLTGR